MKNVIANAFGQIDMQLKRRCELILNLVEAVKKFLQYERETLQTLTLACNKARSASDAVSSRSASTQAVLGLAVAEQALLASLGCLFAVAEAYPELKADQAVRELAEELTSTENKVSFARQAFNDAVQNYNNAQSQFPVVMLARVFGFVPSAMLLVRQTPNQRQVSRVES